MARYKFRLKGRDQIECAIGSAKEENGQELVLRDEHEEVTGRIPLNQIALWWNGCDSEPE